MSMTLYTHCGRVTCMPTRACKSCFELDGELWYEQPTLAHDEEMCPYVSSEERQRRAKARLAKETKQPKRKKKKAERKAKKRAAFGGFQGLRGHLEKKALKEKAERKAQLKAERLAKKQAAKEAKAARDLELEKKAAKAMFFYNSKKPFDRKKAVKRYAKKLKKEAAAEDKAVRDQARKLKAVEKARKAKNPRRRGRAPKGKMWSYDCGAWLDAEAFNAVKAITPEQKLAAERACEVGALCRRGRAITARKRFPEFFYTTSEGRPVVDRMWD